jgi:hypothetical protein
MPGADRERKHERDGKDDPHCAKQDGGGPPRHDGRKPFEGGHVREHEGGEECGCREHGAADVPGSPTDLGHVAGRRELSFAEHENAHVTSEFP